jgi:hypothetical protein
MLCKRSLPLRCVILGSTSHQSTFRLNTRNYVRDRSTTDNPDKAYNSYNLSSIRIGPQSEASGSKSRQPAVTVTVHRSTTSDVTRSKSGQSIAPDFEDSKPVRYLRLLETPSLNNFFLRGTRSCSEMLGTLFTRCRLRHLIPRFFFGDKWKIKRKIGCAPKLQHIQ